MRGRQCGADDLLIAFRNVEDGAAARCEEPFVAVGDEEVGVDGGEI